MLSFSSRISLQSFWPCRKTESLVEFNGHLCVEITLWFVYDVKQNTKHLVAVVTVEFEHNFITCNNMIKIQEVNI